MITLDGTEIKPTKFPDGTIQVWKLPEEILKDKSKVCFGIVWEYESDSEIMILFQLKLLLDKYSEHSRVTLYMPFLPYGRQDKDVSNETTFGIHAFSKIINLMNFYLVETLDAHSGVFFKLFEKCISISPHQIINRIMRTMNFNNKNLVLVFPDYGSELRYKDLYSFYDFVSFSKIRDQENGHIIRMEISSKEKEEKLSKEKDVLIIDDICDGGKTFELVAEALKEKVKDVYLYVSHGIFSKGFKGLKKSGIKRIFTKDEDILI